MTRTLAIDPDDALIHLHVGPSRGDCLRDASPCTNHDSASGRYTSEQASRYGSISAMRTNSISGRSIGRAGTPMQGFRGDQSSLDGFTERHGQIRPCVVDGLGESSPSSTSSTIVAS